MGTPKHAPLPWRVSGSTASTQTTIIAMDDLGHDLVVATITRTGAEALADARLISASPELLQALLYARAALPAISATDREAATKAATYCYIDEVIAKATGGAE